jgi:hypothetical protein
MFLYILQEVLTIAAHHSFFLLYKVKQSYMIFKDLVTLISGSYISAVPSSHSYHAGTIVDLFLLA